MERHVPYGPKRADHPSCGKECLACHEPMSEGQYTTLIPLGPGGDPEAQEAARNDHPYNAIAIEIHWTCATGFKDSWAKMMIEARR